jgi:hypothetical protein
VRCFGVLSKDGAIQALNLGVPMGDKSPRQHASKKSEKSIKEKRAEKRDKEHVVSGMEKLVTKKR